MLSKALMIDFLSEAKNSKESEAGPSDTSSSEAALSPVNLPASLFSKRFLIKQSRDLKTRTT